MSLAKKSKSTKKKKNEPKKKSTWPLQRKVLFRPDRLNYVRKILKPQGCVFCSSAKGDVGLETLCLFKTKYSQVVLNKYPYNNGHLLVLPLEHVGNIFDLSPERYSDLHQTLRIACEAVQKVYEPNGFNVGLNHGMSSGAGIPDHLHYHIVPRWSGDLNFFPLIAETKVVIETLEQSFNKFSEYFNSLKD